MLMVAPPEQLFVGAADAAEMTCLGGRFMLCGCALQPRIGKRTPH
jgi:hypothetical protein